MPEGNYYLDTYGAVDPQQPPLSTPPDDAALPSEPAPSGNYYLDTYGEVEYTPPEPEKPNDDYGWGITTAFKRGFERLRSLPDVAQGDYEELAQHFENMEQYDLSERDQQRMQELQNTDGWWEATAYYFKNPTLIAQIVAESLPMAAAPIAGGVGGGLAGGAAGTLTVPVLGTVSGATIGTIGGAAAGSYATEYLNSITEYFAEEGVDMTDPEQLRQAFSNSEMMEGARSFANKRGIPIAIFDGLSFGLAGRVYKPASALATSATGKALVGGAAEIALQAGAGMAGEASAQLSSEGEITDIPGVIAEGFGEIVPGFVEQGANRYMENRRSQQVDDDLQRQLNINADVPDADLDMFGENPDALSYQAAGGDAAVADLLQQQIAAEELEASKTVAMEAELGAVERDAVRRTEAFMTAEASRDARIEGQRREAEYQQQLAEGEAAAEIAPYETPETTPATEPGMVVTGEPLPGTSVGDALKAAQDDAGVTQPDSEPQVEPETEISPEIAVETPESTKTAEPEVDSVRQALENEITAAEADIKARPNLKAKRRLYRANKALKEYTPDESIDTGGTTYAGSTDAAVATGGAAAAAEGTGDLVSERAQLGAIEDGAPASETATAKSRAADTVPDTEQLQQIADAAATSPVNDLPQPTEAQKAAGNYQKGHVKLKGLDITIENPKGSVRRGSAIKDHYGYVKRTEGADGDQVDVFVNPKIRSDDNNEVFVIDQTTEDGVTFDEHKVMLGYTNQLAAVRAYKRNYSKGWKVGPVSKMSMSEFKEWLKGDTTTPVQSITAPAPIVSKRDKAKGRAAKRGMRFSLTDAQRKKTTISDAKRTVPGADSSFVQKVLGTQISRKDNPDTKAAAAIVSKIMEMEAKADAETTPAAPINKASVESAIESTVKELPVINANVHESIASMPNSPLKKKLQAQKGPKPRAVFDILTDEVHIFADRIKNNDDAIAMLLHEGVAHHGLRALFSKTAPSGTAVVDQAKFNKLITGVYEKASNRKRIRELEVKYAKNKDKITKRDKLVVGEEYIADMAEKGIQPNLLKRVYAAVRQQLRRLGIVNEWTDNDINALLVQTRKALRGKPLEEVMLSEEVEVEETGERFNVETPAATVLRRHDKRANVIQALKGCIAK